MTRATMTRAILVAVAAGASCMPNYSDGERTGYVVKLSRKGIAFKSWEGEMRVLVPGAMVGAGDNTTWNFSVTDPAVVEKVQAAQRSGERVTLTYRQWGCSPLSVDTDYDISDVRP